jgi:aspartate/methionine/tyrosine aminotransferase
MDVLREAGEMEAAGEDVIHMEVGQPFGPAPARVREAAARAIAAEDLGYTEARGIAPLRERIARHYEEHYGVSVDPERIFVTTGSSGAFTIAFLAAFDAGDAVGLANPGYPAYRNIFRALGIEPVFLDAGPEAGWAPDPAEVQRRMRAGMRGLLVASPANPTGAMLEEGRLEALVRAVESAGGVFISDEIYHRLDYARPAMTALRYSPRAIVINSFSKYYGMTGWRIGWMVVPPELVRACEVLAQNMFINAPSVSQAAALAAFDATEELEARKEVYAKNRRYLLAALPEAGLAAMSPADGAFYLYCDVGHLTNDSFQFARRLLHETKVAATPGLDFDPRNGHRWLRFSYCAGHDDIRRAVDRIAGWLQGRREL